MKKTIKIILLCTFITGLLIILVGCGKNDEKEIEEDKIVATKQTKDDKLLGDYNEIVEITFKDSIADKIKLTMELSSEEIATSVEQIYSSLSGEKKEGLTVKAEGKNLLMQMDASTYVEQEGIEENSNLLSKESLIESLEEDGYVIK